MCIPVNISCTYQAYESHIVHNQTYNECKLNARAVHIHTLYYTYTACTHSICFASRMCDLG